MKTISHKFVEYIPSDDKQEVDVLYITTTYNTAVHKCFCGCGQQVVTPLSPTDWRIIYDGISISLYPSIGNWSYECRSHYWVKNGRVFWAEDWSEEKIDANRKLDKQAKQKALNDQKKTSNKSNILNHLKSMLWFNSN